MIRILVIEKSALIATDIVETLRSAYHKVDAVTVNSIEAAEDVLRDPGVVDLCVVSGSATRQRLAKLAAVLDSKQIRTIAISDSLTDDRVFSKGTAHIAPPFTTKMLLQAARSVSDGLAISATLPDQA